MRCPVQVRSPLRAPAGTEGYLARTFATNPTPVFLQPFPSLLNSLLLSMPFHLNTHIDDNNLDLLSFNADAVFPQIKGRPLVEDREKKSSVATFPRDPNLSGVWPRIVFGLICFLCGTSAIMSTTQKAAYSNLRAVPRQKVALRAVTFLNAP